MSDEDVKNGEATESASEADARGEEAGEAADAPPPDPLAEAKAEAQRFKDQWIRSAADFDNFRKRARRELEDTRKAGKEDLLKDFLPVFDNLDISFQGFNTWHSLQYLALTWFILGREAETGRIGSNFARAVAGPANTKKFYLSMIGATLSAAVLYLILWKGLNFPQERSYYVVVLSFLLVHYFYDHILFRDFEPLQPLRGRERLAA